MKPGLTITERYQPPVTVVTLGGFLDGNTSPELERRMAALVASGRTRIVFAMKGLTYISSAGVGVLISIQHQCRAKGGCLVLAQPGGSVREILSLLGINTLLTIHTDETAAVRAAAG